MLLFLGVLQNKTLSPKMVSTMAVAHYPKPNDLHVVFGKAGPDVVSYVVNLVDMHTGRSVKKHTVYKDAKKFSCQFRDIKNGGDFQVEVETQLL